MAVLLTGYLAGACSSERRFRLTAEVVECYRLGVELALRRYATHHSKERSPTLGQKTLDIFPAVVKCVVSESACQGVPSFGLFSLTGTSDAEWRWLISPTAVGIRQRTSPIRFPSTRDATLPKRFILGRMTVLSRVRQTG